jgi:hypothetical protein
MSNNIIQIKHTEEKIKMIKNCRNNNKDTGLVVL